MQQSKTVGVGRHPKSNARRASLLPPLVPAETMEHTNARATGSASGRRDQDGGGRGHGARHSQGHGLRGQKALIETIIFGAALVVSAALGYLMGNLL